MTQDVSKMGVMSVANVTFAFVEAGGSLLSSAEAVRFSAIAANAAKTRVVEVEIYFLLIVGIKFAGIGTKDARGVKNIQNFVAAYNVALRGARGSANHCA